VQAAYRGAGDPLRRPQAGPAISLAAVPADVRRW
jgi:hypothetical protein